MKEDFSAYEEQNYQEFPVGEGNQPVEERTIPVLDEIGMPAEEAEPAKPIFTKAIHWLVYAAVFLVPLFFLPFTADVLELNKQGLLVLLASAGLVLFLVNLVRTGFISWRESRFFWPIVGLAAASALAVGFSANRFASIFGLGGNNGFSLMSILAYSVIFFLGVNAAGINGSTLKKFLAISLMSVFILGIFQIFRPDFFDGILAGSAYVVGGLNSLGILAASSLALFGYGRKKGIPTVFRCIGYGAALFLVIFINWWPVWVVAFVSILASLIFNSVSRPGATGLSRAGQEADQESDVTDYKAVTRMKMLVLPMTVVALGIFLILMNFNWATFKSRLPLEISPTHRASWDIMLRSVQARPMGFGLENFSVAYDKNKSEDIANTAFHQFRFSNGSSEFLTLLVEGGILAALAVAYLIWSFGANVARSLSARRAVVAAQAPIWAMASGLFVSLFFYPASFSIWFVLFALLMICSVTEDKTKIINMEKSPRLSLAGSIIFVIGLVAVLVGIFFMTNRYKSNVYLAKAAGADEKLGAIENLAKALNSNPRDPRIYNLLSQTVVAQLADDLKTGPQKGESQEEFNTRVQNQITSAINISIGATEADPSNAANWSNRGFIYQNLIMLVGGAEQAAINMYGEAIKRNPANPSAYLNIGNIYLNVADQLIKVISSPKDRSSIGEADLAAARKQIEENLKKAEENFQKAISLFKNYGQALYNLAMVYERQGKIPEAIKNFEKIYTANQRDPSIVFQLGLLYYRNGEKDKAAKAWEQAVTLFPKYSNARWYLSLAYEERGELDRALDQVREIEKLNPDNEMVQKRLKQLEAGQRIIPPEKVLDQKPL